MTWAIDALRASSAPGVVADVIFAFSDLEIPIIGPKLDFFASLLPEIIIFNTNLLGHTNAKMHFRIIVEPLVPFP